jgi:hypothetical protein
VVALLSGCSAASTEDYIALPALARKYVVGNLFRKLGQFGSIRGWATCGRLKTEDGYAGEVGSWQGGFPPGMVLS